MSNEERAAIVGFIRSGATTESISAITGRTQWEIEIIKESILNQINKIE